MKLPFRRSKLSICIGVILITGYQVSAAEQAHNEDMLEEIVVTSAFGTSEAETGLPIGILAGEALREKAAGSLGATLRNEIGVAVASFGAGVGQPVIRGQGGNRVKVLQNSVGVVDAANNSPDHANGVEVFVADRIEVIRGPATLLYGSGAIGGVVNVIDNRIPTRLVEETEFEIEQSHNSVNDEDRTIFRLDASSGSFGFHLDGFKKESNNVEIDGFAVDEFAMEELEEHIEETLGMHHDDYDEHEEEEFTNTNGFIGNSDSKASSVTAGFSYVTNRGFVGFSVSELDNEYGLPPGAHSHGHHEEGHDDDHDEEHEEVEFVRLDLEQTRYDFKSGLSFTSGWIESISADISLTDYQHGEVEYFEDGGSEVGTLYEREGYDSRFTLNHAQMGDWTGVWGLQLSDTEFSAVGEEAFIPKSDITSLGLFALERFSGTNYTVEIGARYEDNEVDAGLACDYDDSSSSISSSLLYDVNDESNFLVGISRSERSPGVEELYSNAANVEDACGTIDHNDDHGDDLVLHAATNLLEIGNVNLDSETSNNFELGYRKYSGSWTGEISAYFNKIDDYILLDITGEEIEEQMVARYTSRDATFKGIEAQVTYNIFESSETNAVLTVFGDMVEAEFDRGGNVPRIPSSKLGAELRYFGSDWSAHIHVTRHGEQDDVGRLELETDGYTLLSVYADYHLQVGGESEVKLFVRGDNLLDEEIRNHTSLLKNYAPEPGRAITVGLRYVF
jgi:iron complex outermembrane receptor protein